MTQNTFVIGNSGSGKSTFARKLSQQKSCAHIDLDLFAWKPELGVRRELSDSVTSVARQLESQNAVIEGCYADIIDELATVADHLVFLDVPIEQCVEHCRSRPFEPHKWPSREEQDNFLPKLIEHVRGYRERTGALGREAHLQLFQKFKGSKELIG